MRDTGTRCVLRAVVDRGARQRRLHALVIVLKTTLKPLDIEHSGHRTVVGMRLTVLRGIVCRGRKSDDSTEMHAQFWWAIGWRPCQIGRAVPRFDMKALPEG
jgi:hypothetical protein